MDGLPLDDNRAEAVADGPPPLEAVDERDGALQQHAHAD